MYTDNSYSIPGENARRTLPSWLNTAVFYQIYPQSFYDANGDGIGDIRGIIQKLDYLKWLGIDAVWINPCFVSPFQDAGYDVADYYRIAHRYGTNRDLFKLCREAHRRHIRVCLDLVAGHTSLEHPWFKASCLPDRNRFSDRYIWTSSGLSSIDSPLIIRGYAPRDGNYVSNFFYFQPALNYGFADPEADRPWQQAVDAPGPLETRKELLKIMSYWLSHGVDGFRVDMAYSLVKLDPSHRQTISLWQEIGSKIHELYPEAILIAEWGNPEESIPAGFDIDFIMHFGVGGYADLLLNERCFFRRHGNIPIHNFLKSYLEQTAITRGKGYISIPSGNHDIKRPCSEGRTVRDLKLIFAFLLTWPGVPFIYYGDEIGMRYISGLISKEGGYERTGSRTPMQWGEGPNTGFSSAEQNKLYLPIDRRPNRPTVQKQLADNKSLLNHVHGLLELRHKNPSLQASGDIIPLQVGIEDRYFAFVRRSGVERFLIVINPSATPSQFQTSEIRTQNLEYVAGNGVHASLEEDFVRVKMEAVSYGIFKLL